MGASALLAAGLSASISCTSVLNDDPVLSPAALVKFDSWQTGFCQKYKSAQYALYFEKISETPRNAEIETQATLGYLTIGSIRSGRVKIDWQSTTTKASIRLKVIAMQEAWVFNRSVSPGSEIKEEDIVYKLADVSILIGEKKVVIHKPAGKSTSRQARKGQVITEDLIQEPPLVKRNNHVTITVVSGTLKLISPGIALETGWHIGKNVQVKADNTSGAINAKVTGKDAVLVEM